MSIRRCSVAGWATMRTRAPTGCDALPRGWRVHRIPARRPRHGYRNKAEPARSTRRSPCPRTRSGRAVLHTVRLRPAAGAVELNCDYGMSPAIMIVPPARPAACRCPNCAHRPSTYCFAYVGRPGGRRWRWGRSIGSLCKLLGCRGCCATRSDATKVIDPLVPRHQLAQTAHAAARGRARPDRGTDRCLDPSCPPLDELVDPAELSAQLASGSVLLLGLSGLGVGDDGRDHLGRPRRR